MCQKCCDCLKKIRNKCTDRLMLILNLGAALLIIACLVLRIVYYKQAKQVGKADTSQIMTIALMTPFQFLFSIMLILAEVKVQKVRLYFNFLDSKRGRGFFISLITLTLFDDTYKSHILLIIFSIVLMSIAFINEVVGWGVSSDNGAPLFSKSASSGAGASASASARNKSPASNKNNNNNNNNANPRPSLHSNYIYGGAASNS